MCSLASYRSRRRAYGSSSTERHEMKDRPQVIAIEEHYFDREVVTHYAAEEARPALRHRLEDLGAQRLSEMDEAGVDIQVLSHAAPGTHLMDAATAVPLAR